MIQIQSPNKSHPQSVQALKDALGVDPATYAWGKHWSKRGAKKMTNLDSSVRIRGK